jgi:hypothetical protein
MVRLHIFVRPKTGYSSAKKIQSISVDSSQRLEQIIADLKLPQKGTLLYANGRWHLTTSKMETSWKAARRRSCPLFYRQSYKI